MEGSGPEGWLDPEEEVGDRLGREVGNQFGRDWSGGGGGGGGLDRPAPVACCSRFSS